MAFCEVFLPADLAALSDVERIARLSAIVARKTRKVSPVVLAIRPAKRDGLDYSYLPSAVPWSSWVASHACIEYSV